MPPKKKNRSDISSRPKGAGRIHLEDVYTVDFSTLPIDFVLLKGHVWYLLLSNGSNIIDTVLALLPIFTKDPINTYNKKIVYTLVSKLDNQYKKMRKGFNASSLLATFKEV